MIDSLFTPTFGTDIHSFTFIELVTNQLIPSPSNANQHQRPPNLSSNQVQIQTPMLLHPNCPPTYARKQAGSKRFNTNPSYVMSSPQLTEFTKSCWFAKRRRKEISFIILYAKVIHDPWSIIHHSRSSPHTLRSLPSTFPSFSFAPK